jgi:hypothetical protein
MTNSVIGEYNKIYEVGTNAGLTIIKTRIIQELIQIRRPTNWDINNLNSLITEIVKMEHHNFKTKHQLITFEKKWNFLTH